jgi:hypothetical protein
MDIHIRSLVHTNNPDMPVCMPVQDTQKNARKTDDQGDMDKKNDLQV